ncbi:hypothetical protein SAY86_014352 [Trapa natans]|uniref:RING-type E3 ubiquitin transferase n=1 Tax=Trapa natans TaxID=22666 RepID=A0AAN7QMX5_TRANT|nr:hypothetical protein SAY86_014352 [Trapa natans]
MSVWVIVLSALLPSTILPLTLLALSSLLFRRRRLLLRLPVPRCAVCLDDTFLDKEKQFRVLPECGHGFHKECLDKWLCCRRTCPLCRRDVARDRGSYLGRLLAALLSSFCRWMDSRFDSQLTLLFCQSS